MRVHELIEELSEFDPDAIVSIDYEDILGVKRTEVGNVEILIPEREEAEW